MVKNNCFVEILPPDTSSCVFIPVYSFVQSKRENNLMLLHEVIRLFNARTYPAKYKFKVDRLQSIVVAKKYIYVSQLFISRMPKMCAIPQLVSAPLNPTPIAEHFRRSHPPCEHSRGQHIVNNPACASTWLEHI